MRLGKIRSIRFGVDMSRFLRSLMICLFISCLSYIILIFCDTDKDFAILIAFIILIAMQFRAELKEYKLYQQDSTFLEKLIQEIPELLEKLTDVNRKLIEQDKILRQKLDDIDKKFWDQERQKDEQILQLVRNAPYMDANRLEDYHRKIEPIMSEIIQERCEIEKERAKLTGALKSAHDRAGELLALGVSSERALKEMIDRLESASVAKLRIDADELWRQSSIVINQFAAEPIAG